MTTFRLSPRARVTFRDPAVEVEVPIGITLLEAAVATGSIDVGSCGGNCKCGGCHVRIEEGAKYLSTATEREEAQLEQVFDTRQSSRLACQARIIAGGDIIVHKVSTG